MEKAILKTLAYSGIFNYPLKAWEIHKWLIGKKASLSQVEKGLASLSKSKKIGIKKDCYFLPSKESLVLKRILREKNSKGFLRKAKIVGYLLKIIPWIKLVGVSGGLALNNTSIGDDIDLIILTSKNRLWLTRIFALLIMEIIGLRRKRGEKGKKVAGKVCVNILLEEDKLAQINRNIYLAHEVLQMRVIFSKDGIYQKYLEDNSWVFKYLPNWTTTQNQNKKVSKNASFKVFDVLNDLAKILQFKKMGKVDGQERIADGEVYFLPNDYRDWVLNAYNQKLNKLSLKS